MNFRQFLERDDLPKIQQFDNDAQQVCELKIQPPPPTSPDINYQAEVVVGIDGNRYIWIYSPIYRLIQDAEWWANSYLYSVIDHKPKQATNAKKEAKKSFDEFLVQLKQQKKEILSRSFHEIIHAAKHSHIKNPTIPLHLATKSKILHTYVNHPPELDAHFLQKAFKTLKTEQPYKSFNDFLTKFKELIGEPHFNLLIQKNQKKMISRLYQLYDQNKKAAPLSPHL